MVFLLADLVFLQKALDLPEAHKHFFLAILQVLRLRPWQAACFFLKRVL